MLKLEDLDLEEIAWAMQDDRSMGNEYYLHLDTGEVVVPGLDEDITLEEIDEGNYAYVDRIESYESYRHMEDFTAGLPDGEARTKLEQALVRSKPFRHFRDALEHFPTELEAWYKFKGEAMNKVVIDWLVGIKAIEDPFPDGTYSDEAE
ncbi:hypothetical protein GCM10009715_34360 [Paeniglutamicibacter psychrophenolicus]|uniref:Uncharacterized protein n=1 Tax=Paeniglutamicibacter psychrophenolicus TaxID=257454 RepID=A0ABS4WA02_9MICC|nr:UPF0158 family protein [Paeniglutamicibacter psychrophenolicus]MBP2373025.1 hypothetical protein [Paeniglutamicibacter psychrophenolicus]